MQLPTILSLLFLATTTAAIPASSQLYNRAAYCGTFRDEAMQRYGVVEGDNVDHEGTRCQPMQQEGEAPNDESRYHFYIEAACQYCKIYQYVSMFGIGVWFVALTGKF